jgi:gliding motility-associated lipoprotein GldH
MSQKLKSLIPLPSIVIWKLWTENLAKKAKRRKKRKEEPNSEEKEIKVSMQKLKNPDMRYLIVIALFVGITSCDSNRIYEDYHDMEEAFWHQDSIQAFPFQIEDTSRRYNLFATFRNASSYPFYNLYFKYTLSDSSGRQLTNHLKEVKLFDPKTGEPYGDGLGDLFDHRFALEEGYMFPSPGQYSLSLQQYMRMDTLPFILSVGARVEVAE